MKTKLLFLLLLANISIYAQQYTSIPDINFEKKLIALGIDSSPTDGKVLTSNISSVINLNVADSEIADLTGIEGFTSLAALSCHLNNLTKLDLSKNVKLELLDCRGNKLTNLDFSKLPILKSVFCSENFITSLDVSKNPFLSGLFCSKNELVTLNLKNGNNTNFQKLFFDFTSNPYLSCIEVDNQAYSNSNWVDEKDPNAAYSTYCGPAYTNIPDPNFEDKLIALGIDIDGKNGKVLNARINSLTSLDVSNSSISDLTGIENFRSLNKLNVSNNKLKKLSLLYSERLTSINCSNNSLTYLNLGQIISLTDLDLSHNQLTAVDIRSDLIENLNASSNLFTSFNTSDFDQLKTFNVSNNQLNSLFLGNNKLLSALNCSKNVLTVLELSQNENLTSLSCQNNQIISLDLSSNSLLKEIFCQNNNLLVFNLKSINGNLLQNYDFRNNSNLECILVDDAAFAIANWSINKDQWANYNTECNPYTLIPDANFERALISKGFDSGTPDGKVLTLKIAYITDLLISEKGISNLTGIDNFKSLQNLSCSSNQLTSLDLSKNTSLLSLSCDSNQIGNLKLGQNNTLLNLECSNNKLVNLDISKTSALNKLDCSSNLLTALEVSENTKLKSLDCSYNKLTNLDLSLNPDLTLLNCSNNIISLLNLKNGKNKSIDPTSLNMVKNALLACILVDDPAYSNTNWLSKKDASANFGTTCIRFTAIPDVNFENVLIASGYDSGVPDGKVLTENIENIRELNLYSKNISNLSGIQDFKSIAYLNCTNNQLTSLDVSKNIDLQNLLLGYNKLTSIDLSNNINLKSLTINVNPLGSIDVTKNVILEELGCSNTKLIKLDVSNNPKLKNLNCDDNKLTNLDLSNNKMLRNLDCSTNSLNAITVFSNTELISIRCANNQITDLDISKNILLSDVFCNNNRISKLEVSNNLNLVSLSAANNLLTNMDITKNANLYFLTINGNKLTDINLSQNKKLMSIMCFQNQLKTLDVSKNPQVSRVNCSNNMLTYLNLKNGNNINFEMSEPSYLNFQNNPSLTCILVDNTIFSNATWSKMKDLTANYSNTCGFPIEVRSDNFTVETKGESCTNESNGQISITAKDQSIEYIAIINNQIYPFTGNVLKLDKLAPGTYKLSIGIKDETFEQVFNITIPKATIISGKSSTTAKKMNIEIESGTAPYTIFLNGTKQFTTTDSSFNLNLEKTGLVEVTTAKGCEGIFSKKITAKELGSTLLSYPNPTSNNVEIEISENRSSVAIELYNFSGQLVSSLIYKIENGKTILNLENQPSGVYAAKLYLETPQYLKIIKN